MIGATVVLYNPSLSELNNLANYYYLVDYLYIMDNSVDSNAGKLGEIENNVKYFHYPENIGLCKALNIAIEMARKDGCDWITVFDADSSLKTNIFDIYKKYIGTDNNVAIYAPVHVFDRGNEKQFNGTKEVKWSMTSGCIFNIRIFEEVGGFMEPLFVDGLDIDYCYRVREKGYKVMQCGDALLNHYPGETKTLKLFGIDILSYGWASPKRYYYQARSLIWLFKRYGNYSDVLRYLWKWFKVIFLFHDKKSYIRSLSNGTKDGFKMFKKYKDIY